MVASVDRSVPHPSYPSEALSIAEKILALRQLLSQHQIDGYLIPAADEHLNEYVPTVKQRRTWMSGFTGSAGDLLVTTQQAWVFVDGRYFEQADQEVDTNLIQINKLGMAHHKTLGEELASLGQSASQEGSLFRLGFDPFTLDVSTYRHFQESLVPQGVELVPVPGNLVDQIRTQSGDPLPPCDVAPIFAVPSAFTGGSLSEKVEQVRQKMTQQGTTLLPITKLDQVAWLLNWRGADVSYNPVFMAYAIVTPQQVYVFTNPDRIPNEVLQDLPAQVVVRPYGEYAATLTRLLTDLSSSPPVRILLDPKHTTVGTRQLVDDSQVLWIDAPHPVEALKARKNPVELAGMRAANLKASRAKTRAIYWIQAQIAAGYTLTEAAVADQLAWFYRQEAGFLGLSFNTIAGAGANSSIVHYGTPSPTQTLNPGQLLLIDSGVQFMGGTTDDTRTLVIGDPSPSQINRYTRVLQAHINCARQEFPQGTTGQQLDGITRAQMWLAGLDYNHGTGHGVGAFLNVHEGPNGIHKRASQPLESGMINSIEPGYYEPGWGGIRIENLYTVVELPASDRPFHLPQTWYGFDSLTYIPLEPRLMDWDLLTPEQRQWVKDYHAQVFSELNESLSSEEAVWLHDLVTH